MHKNSYAEKLKSPLWQKKRLEVFESANWKCEEPACQSATKTLEVHHCHYISGREPWEYGGDLLICHCGDCHTERQAIERAIHLALARILRLIPIRRLNLIAWRLIIEALQEAVV